MRNFSCFSDWVLTHLRIEFCQLGDSHETIPVVFEVVLVQIVFYPHFPYLFVFNIALEVRWTVALFELVPDVHFYVFDFRQHDASIRCLQFLCNLFDGHEN